MTPDILLKIYSDSLGHIEKLIADVPDSRLAEMPAGLKNHAAWTLTHLCVGNDFALQCVGQPGMCPPDWIKLAAPGSQPVPDRSAYPALTVVLETLRKQHAAVTQGVRSAPAGHFDTPSPENVRAFAATLGHLVSYFLASHEQNHLGQLQAWKRAAGLMGD